MTLSITIISVLIVLVIIILLICYKTNEYFGSGSRQVNGYYIVEWTPPSNSTPDTTFNIEISDPSGKIIASEKDIKEPKYLFKTGDWNVKYKYTVWATNSLGDSPKISITKESGTGPFPNVKDIFLASQTQNSEGSWITNVKLSAGSAFPTIPLIGVTFDPSIKNQQDLSMLKTSDNPDGSTTINLTGEYTSSEGLSCKIFRDVDNKLEVKYINDFYGITDSDINGQITGFIIDNGYLDNNDKTNPACKVLGGSFKLQEGDAFEVEIIFTNEYGITKFGKKFKVTQTKLNSPNELKTNFVSQS